MTASVLGDEGSQKLIGEIHAEVDAIRKAKGLKPIDWTKKGSG